MSNLSTSPGAYDRYLRHNDAGGHESGQTATDQATDTQLIKCFDITEKKSKVGGRSTIYPTGSSHQNREPDGKYQKYALLLRRLLDDHDLLLSTTLEINSLYIRKYLQDLVEDYPGLNLNGYPIEIREPYAILFHYRKSIREDAEACSAGPEKDHMQLLVEFMRKYLVEVEREYEQNVEKGNPPKVAFDSLWTMFPPKTVVVTQGTFNECFQAYSYEFGGGGGEAQKFKLHAWYWDYDGTLFGPASTKLKIMEFRGIQQLASLPVLPLESAMKDRRMKIELEKIKQRGRLWRDIVHFCVKDYEGGAWVEEMGQRADKLQELVPIHISGRVVIDYNAHQQDNYSLRTKLAIGVTQAESADEDTFPGDENAKEPKGDALINSACMKNSESYVISDEHALLAPARVRGYSLRRKRWAFFHIDDLRSIDWSPNHFEQLKLSTDVKSIILSLVQSHQALTSEDTIATKGSGLVMLLHGPPGAGKTLTAESIAERTRRPLLSLSSGDLGINPDETERRLRLHFEHAKAWNAIILLDEADVFLAKRKAGNISRNAFVSIFLRHLEYYGGILFLTTNRVEEVDAAFQSRVHFSIKYPPLDAEQRTLIWKDLIQDHQKKTSAQTGGTSKSLLIDWGEDAEAIFARLGEELDINGREIKNLLHVAEVVGKAKNQPITEALIRSVQELNQKPIGDAFTRQTEDDHAEEDNDDIFQVEYGIKEHERGLVQMWQILNRKEMHLNKRIASFKAERKGLSLWYS